MVLAEMRGMSFTKPTAVYIGADSLFFATIPRMKSHELFRQLLQDQSAKELASDMKLSPSTIYKWTEPCDCGGSGTPNPLDRIEQLMKVTSARRQLAQWVCQQAGGFFVKNPEVASSKEATPVIVASNKIVQEFADMISLVATAAIDNSITAAEASDIRERWQELKSAAEEFVICCEERNFLPIHARAQALKTDR